jgi:transcriptional regulator with XRE-family HTH domain
MGNIQFHTLQENLIGALRERVRSGILTENALAEAASISQPHINNILRGRRSLTPRIGDKLLDVLGLSALDLAAANAWESHGNIPLFDGLLSPDCPFPVAGTPGQRYPFPGPAASRFEDLAAFRLGRDENAGHPFLPGDIIVADQSRPGRQTPAPSPWHVVAVEGRGAIRKVRWEARRLRLTGGNAAGRRPPVPQYVSLHVSQPGLDLLDVVRGVVIWVGREMEQPTVGAGSSEKARAGY